MKSRMENHKNNKHKWTKKEIVILAIFAALAIVIMAAVGSSDDSSSSSSSSSDSESSKVESAKLKNTANGLNKQISQHQELNGFQIKADNSNDQFIVNVPNNVTAMSKSEQQGVYSSVVKLIRSYDNGTNEGTYIEFHDQQGNVVGHSSLKPGSETAKVKQ